MDKSAELIKQMKISAELKKVNDKINRKQRAKDNTNNNTSDMKEEEEIHTKKVGAVAFKTSNSCMKLTDFANEKNTK